MTAPRLCPCGRSRSGGTFTETRRQDPNMPPDAKLAIVEYIHPGGTCTWARYIEPGRRDRWHHHFQANA